MKWVVSWGHEFVDFVIMRERKIQKLRMKPRREGSYAKVIIIIIVS